MPAENHLYVRRRARYYTLGELTLNTKELWFVCHGYGQSARDFIDQFQVIADKRRFIVAPEGLSRFYVGTEEKFHGAASKVGASWMTREDRETEISDYVEYLDNLYESVLRELHGTRPRITVVGFSQGGATANRWVTRGRSRVDRLIMWGALLASDSDLNEAATFFKKVRLSIVYGTRDRFSDEKMISNYEQLLREKDIPHDVVKFDGGHRLDRDTLKSLAKAHSSAGASVPS